MFEHQECDFTYYNPCLDPNLFYGSFFNNFDIKSLTS